MGARRSGRFDRGECTSGLYPLKYYQSEGRIAVTPAERFGRCVVAANVRANAPREVGDRVVASPTAPGTCDMEVTKQIA